MRKTVSPATLLLIAAALAATLGAQNQDDQQDEGKRVITISQR